MTNVSIYSKQKDKFGTLTRRQQQFVLEMAEHGKASKAAEKAGYSHAAVSANRLMRNPVIVAHLQHIAEDTLKAATPVAARTLIDVATDEDQPVSARIKASQVILSKAGIGDNAIVHHEHTHTLAEASDVEIKARLAALLAGVGRVPLTIEGQMEGATAAHDAAESLSSEKSDVVDVIDVITQ